MARPKSSIKELQEKVEVYENMLHEIQMCSAVTMDGPALKHIIDIINGWSYAHRQGNGELSDEEQVALVRKWFDRMKHRDWKDSIWNSGVPTIYKDAKK